MQGSLKDCLKQRVSIITKSGSISSLDDVWIRDFDDWGLEFSDGTKSTIIAKDEIEVLTIRPTTKQEEEKMLNIPKPEHVPEAPPRFKVGQYIVYHNGDRYKIGRIGMLMQSGAFVSYTEGSGASLTSFSDMHPLVNDYCIEKTTLGGDFFGNSEE